MSPRFFGTCVSPALTHPARINTPRLCAFSRRRKCTRCRVRCATGSARWRLSKCRSNEHAPSSGKQPSAETPLQRALAKARTQVRREGLHHVGVRNARAPPFLSLRGAHKGVPRSVFRSASRFLLCSLEACCKVLPALAYFLRYMNKSHLRHQATRSLASLPAPF